jgi:hypothetical protein
MQFVENKMARELAFAKKIILEIHIVRMDAVQHVSLTQTVLHISHVSIINVVTLVLDLVHPLLHVKLFLIHPLVLAMSVILAMDIAIAIFKEMNVRCH